MSAKARNRDLDHKIGDILELHLEVRQSLCVLAYRLLICVLPCRYIMTIEEVAELVRVCKPLFVGRTLMDPGFRLPLNLYLAYSFESANSHSFQGSGCP